MAGTLFVVATPIGNLEDITARALRVLREVAVIAAEDTRRTAHLLSHYGIATPTTSLHEHNERGKAEVLIKRLHAGESVALVSDAGTPTISDPGVHLVGKAAEAGIKVEPIPGPNAALAALSVAGLETAAFLFLGFAPVRSKDRKTWFERLAKADCTVVFYEAPHRIARTLAELKDKVGDLNVLVARELTKVHEELVRGPISEVMPRVSSKKGEFTVVLDIGHKPDVDAAVVPQGVSADVIGHEFGLLTENRTLSRRQAIATLSRRYGISSREAYKAIEEFKKSGR